MFLFSPLVKLRRFEPIGKPFYERFIGKTGYSYAGFLLLCSFAVLGLRTVEAFNPAPVYPLQKAQTDFYLRCLSHAGASKGDIYNTGPALRVIFTRELLWKTAQQCRTPVLKARAEAIYERVGYYLLENTGRSDWENLRPMDGDNYGTADLLERDKQVMDLMNETRLSMEIYDKADGHLSKEEETHLSNEYIRFAREMLRR